ncbi:methylenetetrahydrofolate reductase (NADPH) [Natronocella acetinitrilica]|uniref:Methylenetetrahydrofolate reductase n=1 Tax=Natronocella acetinitrilica TaxID=414046 RepID=A0AAE3G4A0_9GAMM|nr:methylenetetrahydrofolate reductase [NAD(P)H] [Natronocella acetinitrilica]MCP1675122.1 methylenetetrahydrofolate reductase (NADPH) [Natronocella acetinitrilica]
MTTETSTQPEYSFEFFPPKTAEGAEKLRVTRERLAALGPRFFSVTFGAGGSTRDRTFETVIEIQRDSGIDAAPHLSCIGSTPESISEILGQYREAGIRHIVALRGDMPSGTGTGGPGHFRYANELVEFIREQHGNHFRIEVACYPEVHPQSEDADTDLMHFKRKVDAGADSAMTQYFFNPDAYFRFVDRCADVGVDIPIVPGIMPIQNFKQLARFSDACGAEIPRWLRKRLATFADDRESLQNFGVDVVTELCYDLLQGGAPGLHFYTLNSAALTERIWNNLGLATETE